MSERKLRSWVAAGLIDAETAARIGEYEAANSRPLGLWAAIAIGALAIGLGIISVIAANWEDVPGLVRLSIHFALMAGLGGYIALRGDVLARDHGWWLEAALFIIGLLGMTFFGHIGQVYQTNSPLWQPLAAWLALFAPLLLMRGQSWLVAALVMGTAIYACWDYALQFDSWRHRGPTPHWAWISAVMAMPVLAAPFAAAMRGRSNRPVFWKRVEQIALAYGVGGASLVIIAAGVDDFDEQIMSLASQSVRAAIACVAGLLVVFARRGISGLMSGAILAGAGVISFLAFPIAGSDLMGGVLFMVLWTGIAFAALQAGWRGVFQLAVGVIALRLIVLSFELASDLLTSGFGLILAGLMILGVAWVAVRISREYAPPREEAA